LAKG
jgi:hypothetical protein